MKEEFDFESIKNKAIEQLKAGKPLLGKDGAFAPLLESILNAALEGEMDAHLTEEERQMGNRRNGKMQKLVQTPLGEVTVSTPRDRNSSFDPQFIKKRETILAEGVADRIIGLYAMGNSTREISDWMEENLGNRVSADTISSITDRVLPEIKAWKSRMLDSVYPIVWMDAIHYKVTDERGCAVTRAIYNVLSIDREGHKELLGMYISRNEGANFWLSVLTDLQNYPEVERMLVMSVTIAMPRMSTDPELTTAQSKYVESLARAGAEVHWVALSDPDTAVAEALTCDGLLLPGGGDMDPAFYGQERIPACGELNLLRDAAEPKLLRAFLAADKPVLGICRGIQVMNVVLGGTLYQDIKPFEHVPHNDHWAKVHTVTVRRGTLLSRLLGQDTVLVNSQHHQAADRIAPELEIAALSEDGIVEALEKPDAHFCLGVQWHPEWLSDADPAQQGLFGAFVEACRG